MEKSHPIIKIPLAHRGLHTEKWDENSLPAFENAVANDFGIELDVHLMKDGNIAVIHDANLKRVTGFDVEISSLTKDQLHRYPLLNSKTSIPLLEEVLVLVDGRVPLLVELKVNNEFNLDFALRVLEILKQYPYKHNVAVQSFNPYCVKFLRTNQKMFPVGQLASDELPGQTKFVKFMFKHLFVLLISKPDFLNEDIAYLKKRKIMHLRKKGLPVIAWTIDTLEKKAIAATYADNIIFEKINL